MSVGILGREHRPGMDNLDLSALQIDLGNVENVVERNIVLTRKKPWDRERRWRKCVSQLEAGILEEALLLRSKELKQRSKPIVGELQLEISRNRSARRDRSAHPRCDSTRKHFPA